ncbi:MAG: hypothetical protein ACR2M6_02545 [Vampirovibrionia bacterium]
MMIKFAIPVSLNWYAVGTTIITEDSPPPFEDGKPVCIFVLKKKSPKNKVVIKINVFKDMHEEVSWDHHQFDDPDSCIFGSINGNVSIVKKKENIPVFILGPICEFLNECVQIACIYEQNIKNSFNISEIPTNVSDEMGDYESMLDMADAGFSISEQESIMNEQAN